jgi:O-antigen/teichoic acid export membrane protein
LQGALVVVYQYAGSLILSRTHGVAGVGFFQAASRLTTSLNVLGKSFTTAALPHMVHLEAGAGGRLEEAHYRTVKYLVGLGLPIAAGTTMLAPQIVELFYGPAFGASVLPLRILIWAEVLIFWGFASASALLARDRRWPLSIQAASGGAFSIAAAAVCVPRWGETGAAVAALASEVLAVAVLSWFLAREGVRVPRRIGSDLAACLGACLAMAAALHLAADCPLLLKIPGGAAVYGVALLLARFLDRDEVRAARHILGVSPSGV